jgi:CheY-like chemotaxis protein
MWVLIADDDLLVARSTAAILTQAGYKVELAPDGRNAIERLTTEHFDLFLCDWLMPDVDGTAVVRALKASGKNTPAIILTSALHGPLPLQHAQRVGADGFLQKPASSQALLNAVRSAITKRQAAREAAAAALPPAPAPAAPDGVATSPAGAPPPKAAPKGPPPAPKGPLPPSPKAAPIAANVPRPPPNAAAKTATPPRPSPLTAAATPAGKAASPRASSEAGDEPIAATVRSPTWPPDDRPKG